MMMLPPQPELKTPAVPAVPAQAVIPPGEPMLEIVVNGRVLRLPAGWARQLLFYAVPAWLRDSTVPPPAPTKEAEQQGINKALFEMMRSGIKNLVRLKLGTFMRGIYGPDPVRWPAGVRMPKGREDILPVIVLMLVDFIVTQVFHHPLIVEFDEQTGIITTIRPGKRVAGTVDARNPAGAPGQSSGRGPQAGQA